MCPLETRPRAGEQHQRALEERHQVRGRPVRRHDRVQPIVQIAVRAVLLAEAVALELLPCKSAHDSDAGQVLLERRGHRAFGIVHLFERSAHPAEEEDREADDDGQHRDRHERQPPIHPEHQRHADAQQQKRPRQFHGLRGEQQAHGVHIAGAALHLVAGGGLVVIEDGQVLKVIVKPHAQRPRDRLAGLRGKPTFQIHEHAADQRRGEDSASGQDQRAGGMSCGINPDQRARGQAGQGVLFTLRCATIDDPVDRDAHDLRADVHQERSDGQRQQRCTVSGSLSASQVPQGAIVIRGHDTFSVVHLNARKRRNDDAARRLAADCESCGRKR
jgi:hypothetical protein